MFSLERKSCDNSFGVADMKNMVATEQSSVVLRNFWLEQGLWFTYLINLFF